MSHSSNLPNQLQPIVIWLTKHLTPHRFLWLVSVVCFLIAWNRGVALLYGLLALILALIIISWVGPWWNLRQLKIQRQQQGQATAGQQLKIQYLFSGQSPGYFLNLMETIPGNEQQKVHFIHRASAGSEVTLSYDCPQRGVFQLPACDVSSGWPFGFLPRRLKVPAGECRIEVLPKTFVIQQLIPPVNNTPIPDGSDSFLQRNAHSEFAGVRPYRQGDSLKHIHWGATARQQQLISREFHSFATPCWLVLIDAQQGNALGQGADNSFEYAIQIAASLLHYARQQQLHFRVIISAKQTLELDLQPGRQDISDLISALARVTDDGDIDYASFIQQTLKEYGDNQALITIRKQSQTLDIQHPAGHIDVVYNDKSFDIPMARYPEGWSQPDGNRYQLDLHRLSNLAQVWQS